jgi:hypothetical protein
MRSCSTPRRPTFAPTDALPGSPEKIRVLAERVRLHLPLWHPLDARFSGDPAASGAPADGGRLLAIAS